MHRRQARSTSTTDPVEHQRRGIHESEGARHTTRETQEEEGGTPGCHGHGGRGERADQEGDEEPAAAGAGQAGHGGHERAGKVAGVVRGGEETRRAPGHPKILDHEGQDRRVDESPDADSRGHGRQASEGEREQPIRCGRWRRTSADVVVLVVTSARVWRAGHEAVFGGVLGVAGRIAGERG